MAVVTDMVLVTLPAGRTRVVAPCVPGLTVAWLQQRIEELEGIPVDAQRLVCGTAALRPEAPLDRLDGASLVSLRLRLPGGGGDGD